MGEGIVHRLLTHGLHATLIDVDERALQRVTEAFAQRASWRLRNVAVVADDLDRVVTDARGRLVTSSRLSDVEGADYIIETISERLDDKLRLYDQLSRCDITGVTISSNTSVIPIETLARAAHHVRSTVGIHFMNPADMISSVEVVLPAQASADAVNATQALLSRVEMSFVTAEDKAGFISNRILMPMVNEAVRLLDSSSNSPESIDAVFRRSMGHAMGPLETADLIGLDTIQFSLENLASLLGSDFYLPAQGLTDRVAAGLLGVKSGEGFYVY
jgi:3-hydroxyacyl-CoA dehydrogenase